MQIFANGTEIYLYLNGIGVSRKIQLSDNVQLLPANCSPAPSEIIRVSKSEIDLGIITIFLKQVRSQFRITEDNPKKLAVVAWNSVWDALLLGAIYDCDAICNFQSDKPAEKFDEECMFVVTNYHLRGLTNSVYMINEEDTLWLEKYFQTARQLLEDDQFQNAVHCLATYRWHTHPRAQLALIWAGIEGLFNIQSELVFRLSLYIAKFLATSTNVDMKHIFLEVKRLYGQRSAAVHGAKMKGQVDEAVRDSVQLLRNLLKQCVIVGDLPQIDDLAP